MPKIAFLFPGQGAQHVGMGRALCEKFPAAKKLYDEASEIVGYDIAKRCFEGPAADLDSTKYSQPAIFVTSMAALEMLRAEKPERIDACSMAAGLSLGQSTALTFAGALSFADGLRLVQRRGEVMQQATDAKPSGMVSIVLLPREQVEAICKQASEAGFIQIANYLCPGNFALAGERAACARAGELAEAQGGRALPLAVSGAFHTKFMHPADERLAECLARIPIKAPRIPVISNVDVKPHHGPEDIRAGLVKQVVSPVLWEDTMQSMLKEGVDEFYEIGPGRVLRGLLKRIDRKVVCHTVNDSP